LQKLCKINYACDKITKLLLLNIPVHKPIPFLFHPYREDTTSSAPDHLLQRSAIIITIAITMIIKTIIINFTGQIQYNTIY